MNINLQLLIFQKFINDPESFNISETSPGSRHFVCLRTAQVSPAKKNENNVGNCRAHSLLNSIFRNENAACYFKHNL